MADLEAYNRQYEDDHSSEQLQEDEFGRLRPLASRTIPPACTQG